GLDHGTGPVPAHVVMSAQGSVVVDDHEEVPTRDVGGHVLAGRLQVMGEAEEQPLATEDLAAFARVHVSIAVPRRGQRRRSHPRSLTGSHSCGSSCTAPVGSAECWVLGSSRTGTTWR